LFPARQLPVAFRADARRLALGSQNHELVLWDTSVPARPAVAGALRLGGGITAAAWNPAAAISLATVSVDGTMATWRILDDRPPQLIGSTPARRDRPVHIDWLEDGRQLFGTTASGRSMVWHTGGAPVQRRPPSAAGFVVAAYEWAGAVLTVTHSGRLQMWDPVTGAEEVQRLPGRVIACARSASLLAVAHDDGRIALFDRELRQVASLRSAGRAPGAMALSADGRTLVLAAADGTTVAVDLAGGRRWLHRSPQSVPAVLAVAGDVVAVVRDVSRPYLLNLHDGTAF
jgi:WD40 repeat protein